MSLFKSALFLGSLIYFYKFLSDEDKNNIKKTLLEKLNKYKPKIIEIINLLDSFNNDQIVGIRNEVNLDYKKKCDDLISVIDSFNEEEMDKDLDDIISIPVKNKKQTSSNIKNTKKNINIDTIKNNKKNINTNNKKIKK